MLSDIRYAIRTLVRSPGFTFVAVLTLALGIGANTAIFSALDQVVLRMLPVERPQELVLLSQDGFRLGSTIGRHPFSYPMYRDIRDHNEVFDGLMARHRFTASVGRRGEAQWMFGELVSGNYFELLGVKAAIGRTITPADDRTPNAHPVMVLSHDLWASQFGSDPEILGETVVVNGHPFTVIGVTGKSFNGVELGLTPKFQIPMMMTELVKANQPFVNLETRETRWLQVFGRLRPGISREQASASLQPLYRSMLEEEASTGFARRASEADRQRFLESRLEALPGGRGVSEIRGGLETPMWALMALVGVVLLAACVNLANLLIARAARRRGELAVRMAIGAGRGRIIRQLLHENVVLAVLGGAAGIMVAPWMTEALLGSIPVPYMDSSPFREAGAIDWRILAFTLTAAAVSVLLFGLAPALLAGRMEPFPVLKQQATIGTGGARFRRGLIAVQVALSLVVLIGASLFARSFQNLESLDPGFRTQDVISFTVDPSLQGYPPEAISDFYRRLPERLRAVPGIEAAALGMYRLLEEDEWNNAITVEGYEPQPDESAAARFNGTSPGYFETLEIPLLAGRDFRVTDRADSNPVAIVNESFARHYFGERGAVGRRIGLGDAPGIEPNIEIIGVVGDARCKSMREEIPRQVFLPTTQLPFAFGMNGYVRSSLPPDQLIAAIRTAIAELDPALPIFGVRTMEQQRDRSLATELIVAVLAMLFGVVAALLTAIGLYGILSQTVARRTRELGLRMALGARPGGVTWLVVKEVLLLAGIGAAVAVPTAVALGRLVESQLYGVAPRDPWTIAAAVLFLAIVAAVAAAVPARRAARIDPMNALRYE